MTDITPVIQAVIALIAAVITTFIIPYIKKKMSAEDLEKLKIWVEMGVKTAEQLCINGVIRKDQRKNYVLNFLIENGFTVDISVVDAMIESLVYELPPLFVKEEVNEEEIDPEVED